MNRVGAIGFHRWVIFLLAGMLAFGTPLSLAYEMKAKPPAEEQKAAHVLDRITFGPRPGDLDRVMKMGWKKYLEEQLQPDRIDDSALDEKLKGLESIHLSNRELAQYYPPPQVVNEILKEKGITPPGAQGQPPMPPGQEENPRQAMAQQLRQRQEFQRALAEKGYKPGQQVVVELQQAKILRAVYSERQLQEVMTDFWFNHFNIFIQKGADRVLTTSYERDVIRPRVFGKFEDLLKATAESPAMLFYLDNWMSATPNMPERGALARRMRLGNQMPGGNQPNAPQRRARGINENYAREIMELHTLGVDGGYTQKDVQEVARCFTGWTLRNPRQGAEFVFVPFMHDDGEKTVLGRKIPAGGGKKDGETVIRILATHPSTAKFISTKLARKFVSDNPPQSLIDKMAKTFQQTEGDIRQVLLAMFNSKEFWAPESFQAKIKTPFEMTVSAVRALGAETNGGPAFHRWIAQMGEGLFLAQPPTGYPDTAEHWVNTGALLARMNFALALTSNRIPGTRVDWQKLGSPPAGNQTTQVVDHYVNALLRGNLSPQSRATIEKTIAEQVTAQLDAAKIAGLILGSPEFQRQ